MNLLEAALRRTARDLRRFRQPWALVGGFAVSVRSEPRFTRDVDVAAAVDSDAEAEALADRLVGEGYRLLASIEHDATGRLATVRLGFPVDRDDGVMVDVLFASSGIEPEIIKAAERVEIVPGLVLPTAATGYLIALKVLAATTRPDPRISPTCAPNLP